MLSVVIFFDSCIEKSRKIMNNQNQQPAKPEQMPPKRRGSWMEWAFKMGSSPSHGNPHGSHYISQNEYTQNLWVNQRRRSSGSGING
ncbi:hypothetical protein TRVA0_005S03598 [Trichomonascus vanleenenianus]|uniref:uncharacterized protein n=1 Tax=Trichomonascus vanleenenianus TaxID=2268995 RepID=UPI003EC98C9B